MLHRPIDEEADDDDEYVLQATATYNSFAQTQARVSRFPSSGVLKIIRDKVLVNQNDDFAMSYAVARALGSPHASPHVTIPTDLESLIAGIGDCPLEPRSLEPLTMKARKDAVASLQLWIRYGNMKNISRSVTPLQNPDTPVVSESLLHAIVVNFNTWLLLQVHTYTETQTLRLLSEVAPAFVAIHCGIRCVDRHHVRAHRADILRYTSPEEAIRFRDMNPRTFPRLVLTVAAHIFHHGMTPEAASLLSVPRTWTAVAVEGIGRLVNVMAGAAMLPHAMTTMITSLAVHTILQNPETLGITAKTSPKMIPRIVGTYVKDWHGDLLEETVAGVSGLVVAALESSIKSGTLATFPIWGRKDLEHTVLHFGPVTNKMWSTSKYHPPIMREPRVWGHHNSRRNVSRLENEVRSLERALLARDAEINAMKVSLTNAAQGDGHGGSAGSHGRDIAELRRLVRRPSPYKHLKYKMIESPCPDLQPGKMKAVLDYFGKIPFQINRFSLNVQGECARRGFPLDNFCPVAYSPVTTKGSTPKEKELKRQLALNNRVRREWYMNMLREVEQVSQGGTFYVPHKLDFRGRIYPVPVIMNHTSSGQYRSLFLFGNAKPLGASGLKWLKIHAANMYGHTKLTFEERQGFIDDAKATIHSVASSPFGPDCDWWQTAESPFEFLVACRELSLAWTQKGGPARYECSLPVQVDGTANGLQHWAAIARDHKGAVAVNMTASPKVEDVYSHVLKNVVARAAKDAAEGHAVAQRAVGTGVGLDKNHLKRSTVKRAVMTQVYGVTQYGMAEMILGELTTQNDVHTLWSPRETQELAKYVRDMVNDSLGTIFRNGHGSRQWLTDAAKMLMDVQPKENKKPLAWWTPLRMSVIPPYYVTHRSRLWTEKGISVVLTKTDSASKKQIRSIAPNLIHSLDAAHLAMTAMMMQEQELDMVSVHDSYWSQACDMETMTSNLRLAFVNLYETYDPLVDLKQQWSKAFGKELLMAGVSLPPVPPVGKFDLRNVLDAEYFFS